MDGAEMIDHAIGLCIGIWMVLIGYRKIEFPAHPEKREEWLAKHGGLMRRGGILVITIALALIIAAAFHHH